MSLPEKPQYVVRQFNWLSAGDRFVRGPGERRIAWFDSMDAANIERNQREQRVRSEQNPFAFGTAWHHLTTMPEYVYRDWLLEAGVEPQAQPDLASWRAWYDEHRDRWTESQLDAVWAGLNHICFYDVISRRPSEVGYCITRIEWDYDDSWYHAGHEGGTPLTVFRTRERAEQERLKLEEALMDSDYRYLRFYPRDPDQFLLDFSAEDESTAREEAPGYEVIEIDLPGGA